MNVYIFPYLDRIDNGHRGGLVAVANDAVEAATMIARTSGAKLTDDEWEHAIVHPLQADVTVPTNVWMFPERRPDYNSFN